MALGYLVIAVVSAALVVFAFQNGTPVSLRFLTWTVPSVSLAALTLLAFAAGVVAAGVPLWLDRWRARTRVRTLERQVAQLETSLADRDRALLGRTPRPGGH
jgi:uncharacterized integral membrane protein